MIPQKVALKGYELGKTLKRSCSEKKCCWI